MNMYEEKLKEIDIVGLYRELAMLNMDIQELQFELSENPFFMWGEELADLMADREAVLSEIHARKADE